MSGITVKAAVERNACRFGGKIHGDDGYQMDVEFECLLHATDFIAIMGLRKVARIRSDENGVSQVAFDKPVVVQFNISEEPNA